MVRQHKSIRRQILAVVIVVLNITASAYPWGVGLKGVGSKGYGPKGCGNESGWEGRSISASARVVRCNRAGNLIAQPLMSGKRAVHTAEHAQSKLALFFPHANPASPPDPDSRPPK